MIDFVKDRCKDMDKKANTDTNWYDYIYVIKHRPVHTSIPLKKLSLYRK